MAPCKQGDSGLPHPNLQEGDWHGPGHAAHWLPPVMYHLMYMLDELFFVFKKLWTNDFNVQCMVAYRDSSDSVTPMHGVAWK